MKYIDYSVAEAADLMTVLGFETETAKPAVIEKAISNLSGAVEQIIDGGNHERHMPVQSNDGQQTGI